jgi:AbrB family looped-hinge helix DNA binding protein
MVYVSKLTTKSQITVPKDVRAVLGVGPGERVKFDIGEDGRVALVAANDEEERERRKAEFLRRLAKVSAEFRKNDPLPGMDGLTYQRMMRGDGPEV